MNKLNKPLGMIILTAMIIYCAALPARAAENLTITAALYGRDSIDDLAIGVPYEDRGNVFINNGLVDVLYGKYLGLDGTDAQEWMQGVNGVQGVTEHDDNFGYTLAAGDFNGDNMPDLVIGAPFEGDTPGVDVGVVHVLYGTPNGINADDDQMLYESDAGGTTEANDRFGMSFAVGDFNCDRYDDLAIGIPHEDLEAIIDAGALVVVYGSPTGLRELLSNQFWHQDRSGVDDIAEVSDHFAEALASGDFNGDSCDDLAVGVPGEDYNGFENAGIVHVFYGSDAGISTTGIQLWHQDSIGILDDCEAYDSFGAALISGDFNGDGTDDLAIGAPNESISGEAYAGVVNVLYSTSSGLGYLNNQIWHQDIANIEDQVEDGDKFGSALASCDFDADGYDDLAVGVPFEVYNSDILAGVVNVIYGSFNRLTITGNQLFYQNDTHREEGEKFGFALASGFFNGDQYCDLAIGAFGGVVDGNDDAGEVSVIYGFIEGLWSVTIEYFDQGTFGVPGNAETGDNFGFALARIGLRRYHLYLPLTLNNY